MDSWFGFTSCSLESHASVKNSFTQSLENFRTKFTCWNFSRSSNFWEMFHLALNSSQNSRLNFFERFLAIFILNAAYGRKEEEYSIFWVEIFLHWFYLCNVRFCRRCSQVVYTNSKPWKKKHKKTEQILTRNLILHITRIIYFGKVGGS